MIHVYDLFEFAGCVGKYDPVRHLLYRNLLCWNMDLSSFINVSEDRGVNLSMIPPASFEQNIECILNTIDEIESDVNTRQQNKTCV